MMKPLLLGLALVLSVVAAEAQQPSPSVRCDCCAKKPQIDDPVYNTFTGQIAIVTQAEDALNSGNTLPWRNHAVMIWDLKNQAAAPRDTWWTGSSTPPTTPYSHVDWTTAKVGSVFGITLDGVGNIYVAATRIYGNNTVGSLSTATGAAAAGQIYRLSATTGAPAPFGPPLPQGAMGEGIGNIHFDCQHNSLYATDLHDGLIYRLNAASVAQPNAWDPGLNLPSAVGLSGVVLGRAAITGFDGSSSYAALGRRPVAVTTYAGRLWYSVWNENWYRVNNGGIVLGGTHQMSPPIPTEIWSVALDANGDPVAPARLEITLPVFSTALGANYPYTNPVMDMAFGPMGTMLVAERTMAVNNSSYAHSSRLLEFSWTGSQWTLSNPTAYQIGTVAWPPGVQTNAAGGVDIDRGPGGLFWATGDALHWLPFTPYIYGIQGLPAGGGTHVNSILIDANDYTVAHNKTEVGDVRIPCPDCSNPIVPFVITGPQTTCVSTAQYSLTPQVGVTYTWTVTGATPTTGTGSSITIVWGSSAGGSVTVTATAANGCTPQTVTKQVAPCPLNCEFCTAFHTTVVMTHPVSAGSGLHTVTPTITSTMPNVTMATVTLLSTTVAYSSTACGTSGPLPAYIPSASPSSIPALNPPLLPVINGNQVLWHATAGVSLTGGVTLPFQLQLPPPPTLSNPLCSATYSFCLRISLIDPMCRSCDVIRCFGPYTYVPSTIQPVPVPVPLPGAP